MKKILFVVALVLPLSISALSAQNGAKKAENSAKKVTNTPKAKKETPLAVRTAFKQRFPTVTKVGYDLEKNGEYEAGFKLNGLASSANFTATGEWRETESTIATSALPAEVVKAISTKYPTAKIVGAAKIETADNGTQYEADLKTGLKKMEVLLDASGNFVK